MVLELTVDEAYAGGHQRLTVDLPTGPCSWIVNLPPRMADGQLIRLVGKGGTRPGGRRGDLYLVVQLANDPRYRVRGGDLVVRLPVAPWEAVLGASLEIATPAGRLRLRVPPGSWSGRRLRVTGLGLRGPGGRLGDMVTVVEVVVPRRVSDVERALFRQLAAQSAFAPRRVPASGVGAH